MREILRPWYGYLTGVLVAGIVVLIVLFGVGVGDGDGGGDDAEPERAGPGTSAGLEEVGMTRCAGPVRGKKGANLYVYADPDLALVLASGEGVIDVSIDYVHVRTGNESAPSGRKLWRVERSWRRTAFDELERADPPAGPCKTVAEQPVLRAAEVVCANEILLPLGRSSAKPRLGEVLGSLVAGDRAYCPEL